MSVPLIVDRVVAVLRGLPPQPDTAPAVHAAALVALRSAGFYVEHEVGVTLPDGRGGRFDIVACMGPEHVAIEIDARSPREKSIAKLLQFDGGRVVALRGVCGFQRIDGIDAVVPIRVRMASRREQADKRAVSRAVAIGGYGL